MRAVWLAWCRRSSTFATKAADPRAIGDKKHTEKQLTKLMTFLMTKQYPHPVSKKTLQVSAQVPVCRALHCAVTLTALLSWPRQSPSAADFNKIVHFLIKQVHRCSCCVALC